MHHPSANDLTVRLRGGRTVEEMVDRVIRNELSGTTNAVTDRELMSSFGLSADHAKLARERTIGGILRAARNPGSCPDRDRDPVAWASFRRATADPSIVARIIPPLAGQREPPARASEHPKRCKFCGSEEFWNLGFSWSLGTDVKTGERCSWATYVVRCAKCQATFHADDLRSELDHTVELVWRLGRG